MQGVFVHFAYGDDFDRQRIVNVAEKARETFVGMAGLRFKFFTLDEERRRATNFYVWESDDAARTFFSKELTERVTGLYGTPPSIEFAEILAVADNSGLAQPASAKSGA